MMQLTALSAGAQAPRDRFNGAVHSVFRQACNIRLDDGRLLALLTPESGNVPHGVRLEVPAGFAFADHLTAGRPVGCRAGVLRVTGAGLSVDLGTAEAWSGELPATSVDLAAPKVAAAWRVAWAALRQNRRENGDARLAGLARTVDARALRLAWAARHLRADEAARALGGLIGCGPGLTPSGDDLVVGFLAGLCSTTGHDPARQAFLHTLCGAVAEGASGTGDISRAYLSHATRGRFAEPLATLVGRIADGADGTEVERTTAAALRVGHTSGGDGVLGLLLGLAAWSPSAVSPEALGMPVDG